MLQAVQIPNFYLDDVKDTEEVAVAKSRRLALFDMAEMGEHAKLAPLNTDVQALQIDNAYIEDTAEVAAARARHLASVALTETGGLAKLQAEQIPNLYLDDVEPVKTAKATFRAAFDKAVVSASGVSEDTPEAESVAVSSDSESLVHLLKYAPPLPIVSQHPSYVSFYSYQIPVQVHALPVQHYSPFQYPLISLPITANPSTNTVEEAVEVEEV